MDRYNLLPADTYIVINKSIITDVDRKILSMLYQPIIGPLPVMLYLSLFTDLDKMSLISVEYTHHHLVSNMHLSLDEIVSSRHKLEAIGLIKTRIKEGDINNYIYELYSPLSSHDIFNHPILNIILYNNVGKLEYEKLKDYFKMPKINTSGYTDITKSFSDVFESVPLTSAQILNDDIRRVNKLKLNINTNFDFDFLLSSMPKGIDIVKCFNKEVKELILNLSFIYDIDAMKMQNIIKGCFNERGTINKDDLRKACRNYYQFDNGGLLPSIVTVQPEYLRKPIGDSSKRAKMIYTFETISPYDLLKGKNNGAEPTKRDLRLAEDLIVDYGLKPGVVNVLIDYTLKTQNNKLTRAFIETIAGQWKRLKIETVDDAMHVAEKEHKKYNKKEEKKVIISNKETIPDWFDKKIEKKQVGQDEKVAIEELLEGVSVMDSISKVINNKYRSYEDKLEYDFNKAMEDDKFNKVASSLKISKKEIMKHTTKIETTVSELNNCSKCKNLFMCKNAVSGYVYYPVVENEQLVMCYMPCRYQKQMDKNNAYYKNIALYDMPSEIRNASMGDIYTDDASRFEVIKWLKTYIDDYKKGEKRKGLYLTGNFGSGKTYLVSAMLNELAKADKKIAIVYYPEFLRSLKASFSDDNEYNTKFNYIKKVELLLIDDIGAETTTA